MTLDFYNLKVDNNYQAYLIRFKRREAQSSWRASLENVHTRETLTFATEGELLVYLLQILSELPDSRNPNADPDIGTNTS